MKIFLSWSGEVSKRVALTFREWLPSVIQAVVPYVSSEDIDKGTRWSTDIAKELEEASFGMLCITPENLSAPWIHFEAGALSKAIDKSFVCPFLLGVKRSEVNGPILQFQSTIFDKEDVKKLVFSINAACLEDALEDARLNRAFDVWWPTLEAELKALEGELHGQSESTDQPEQFPLKLNEEITGILEEILDLTRTQQKILRSPEDLIPIDYMNKLINRSRMAQFEHPVFYELEKAGFKLIELFHRSVVDKTVSSEDMKEAIMQFEKHLGFILSRSNDSRYMRKVRVVNE
ncbi:TIR domain-containing protein [Brevibacillus sp. HB1.1]|uniref:TIR domain-containing protein n=1 Tax=Brevibacillus sp. HB1.1 TaxID=2738808 RepID=UPI001576D1B9|nr:TIR domain-containing protein [Brevibacillus sp. HB1.1]NTU28864.1 TIR domain-containing protein [Brevibacillus sp. HB1.1]